MMFDAEAANPQARRYSIILVSPQLPKQIISCTSDVRGIEIYNHNRIDGSGSLLQSTEKQKLLVGATIV